MAETTRLSQLALEVFVASPAGVRTTQLALELFQAQPARARTSQLALEIYTPVAIPTRLTQVGLELFDARPALLRLSQQAVELWVVLANCPGADLGEIPVGGLACDDALPLAPSAGGSCQAPLLP